MRQLFTIAALVIASATSALGEVTFKQEKIADYPVSPMYFAISADQRSILYIEMVKGKTLATLNGKVVSTPDMTDLEKPAISADGKSYAFTAKVGGKYVLVYNGQVIPGDATANDISFSGDGKHHVAMLRDDPRFLLDGKFVERKGLHIAYCTWLEGGPKSVLLTGWSDKNLAPITYVDDKLLPNAQVSAALVMADGKIAYVRRQNNASNAVMLDGKILHPLTETPRSLSKSPDGTKLFCLVKDGIFINGKKSLFGPGLTAITGEDGPASNHDGSLPVVVLQKQTGAKTTCRLWAGGKLWDTEFAYEPGNIAVGGTTILCIGQKLGADKAQWFLNDQPFETAGVTSDACVSPDGKTYGVITIQKVGVNELVLHRNGKKEVISNVVSRDRICFSPDSKHVAVVQKNGLWVNGVTKNDLIVHGNLIFEAPNTFRVVASVKNQLITLTAECK